MPKPSPRGETSVRRSLQATGVHLERRTRVITAAIFSLVDASNPANQRRDDRLTLENITPLRVSERHSQLEPSESKTIYSG
jgi:hypothetical protein